MNLARGRASSSSPKEAIRWKNGLHRRVPGFRRPALLVALSTLLFVFAFASPGALPARAAAAEPAPAAETSPAVALTEAVVARPSSTPLLAFGGRLLSLRLPAAMAFTRDAEGRVASFDHADGFVAAEGN